MRPFDKTKLIARLDKLRKEFRIAFAASCCERLLPNYCAFAAVEKWGNPSLLRETLDGVWTYLKGGSQNWYGVRIPRLIRQVHQITPNTEEFSSRFTSAALDAGVSTMLTLEIC